jgi:hypothetical protein
MKAAVIYRDDREKSDYPRGGFCLTLSGETGRDARLGPVQEEQDGLDTA